MNLLFNFSRLGVKTMRGFLECYGFRPRADLITLDEIMTDEESEDVMDVFEQDDDWLAAMDGAAWEEFKQEALYNGEDQGDYTL